ncbi:hypothetical protein PIB30_114916, partial [Stylosanthes scabra]|nr:hypothetical protein [Stylosanthes scabra]
MLEDVFVLEKITGILPVLLIVSAPANGNCAGAVRCQSRVVLPLSLCSGVCFKFLDDRRRWRRSVVGDFFLPADPALKEGGQIVGEDVSGSLVGRKS